MNTTNVNNTQLLSYCWAGVNRHNEKVNGIIKARHIVLAKNNLCAQGIIIKKISRQRNYFTNYLNKKISSGDIAMFSRQLATLISAGVPIVQACKIISKTLSNQNLGHLISQIKHYIETGKTFAEALQQHSNVFNELFCNLIDVGEKSGSLDIMLCQLAAYQENIETIKKKIKKAITYPIFVLIVSFLITTALLIFVVPQFETLFSGFGAELPVMTRTIIKLSKILQTYWASFFIVVISCIYVFIYTARHSPKLADVIDRSLLACPIIGIIIKQAALARFARTLAITVAAGLPLVDALKAVAGAVGNNLYKRAIFKIQADVAIGHPLHLAIQNNHLFSDRMVQMIAIGEESGNLELMLSNTANFYEQEVSMAVDILSSLLEPIIMVILGMLVGGVVIAMYLPIFKLGSVI